MATTPEQERFHADALVLARIGDVLASAEIPTFEVRLPRSLADLAVAAWERDETGRLDSETTVQRSKRHWAGSLALTGLSIEEHGRVEGDEVVVPLTPNLIGDAFVACDELT